MNEKILLPISLDAIVLDCKNVAALSDFYIRLLGWSKFKGDDEWTEIANPSGGVLIAFQKNEEYNPPVWPDMPDAQQQMVHLDFRVQDQEQMEGAVQHALSCGARKADYQENPEKWITMIDPAGHPFCFVVSH